MLVNWKLKLYPPDRKSIRYEFQKKEKWQYSTQIERPQKNRVITMMQNVRPNFRRGTQNNRANQQKPGLVETVKEVCLHNRVNFKIAVLEMRFNGIKKICLC